jgi:hypothetical protein
MIAFSRPSPGETRCSWYERRNSRPPCRMSMGLEPQC